MPSVISVFHSWTRTLQRLRRRAMLLPTIARAMGPATVAFDLACQTGFATCPSIGEACSTSDEACGAMSTDCAACLQARCETSASAQPPPSHSTEKCCEACSNRAPTADRRAPAADRTCVGTPRTALRNAPSGSAPSAFSTFFQAILAKSRRKCALCMQNRSIKQAPTPLPMRRVVSQRWWGGIAAGCMPATLVGEFHHSPHTRLRAHHTQYAAPISVCTQA